MIERLDIGQDYKPITWERMTDCILSLMVGKIEVIPMTYHEKVTADLYFSKNPFIIKIISVRFKPIETQTHHGVAHNIKDLPS
jgi:hypothetical protein